MAIKKINVWYLEQSNDIDQWCASFTKHLQAVFHSYISKEIIFEPSGLADPSKNKEGIIIYNNARIPASQVKAMDPYAVICFDLLDTASLSNVFTFSVPVKSGRHRLSADSEYFHNDYWVHIVDCSFAVNLRLGAQSSSLNVYLGEAGTDQQSNRDILRRELVQLGYSVLPASHLPIEAAQAEQSIKAMLSQSVAAVLLIGTDPGKHVDGAKPGIVEYQHTVLRQHIAAMKTPIPLVFLFEDFSQFTTDQQLSYLQRMQMSIDADSGAEVLQMPVEKFKQELLPIITGGIVKDISAQHSSVDTSNYIIGKSSGTLFANCKTALTSSSLMTLEESLSPTDKLLQHRKYLANADRVVLCYEGQPSEWLIAMLQDILKAPGFGRKKMFDKIILLFTPHSAPDMKTIFPYIKTLPLVEYECAPNTDMVKILKNS